MSRSERMDNDNKKRKDRRMPKRKPELGYYLIVTDTKENEKNYFNGLRDNLPDELKDRIVIKVIRTDTQNLISKCKELMAYDPQYRIPWIVFDRDNVQNFDNIIREAEKEGIHVAWSNPCFEIWLFAYYGKIPVIEDSNICSSSFERLNQIKTGQEDHKKDKQIYKRLRETGDEENAIRIAENKMKQCQRDMNKVPSKMFSVTTVYELIKDIQSKL